MLTRHRFDPSRHENNLNTIRLILATLVMVSHSFPISYGELGTAEPFTAWTHGQETFGSLAVDLFFVISGMLITASRFRSKNMQSYLMSRVLRIYPGFIAATFFSAILIWILCPEFRQQVASAGGSHAWSPYFFWGRQFLADLISLSSQSVVWSGIFVHNPIPATVNGSLWTIPIEFSCYLLVAIIGMFGLLHKRFLIFLAAVIVCGAYIATLFLSKDPWFLQPRFFAYFMVGMCICLFRDRIRFWATPAIVCAVILLAASQVKPLFSILFPVAGSYLVLWLGFAKVWKISRWTSKTDISYGVYLYAFPIQQVVAMNPAMRSQLLNLAISIPLAYGMAWLSWHFLEKRFLKLKHAGFPDFDPAVQIAPEIDAAIPAKR